MFSAAFSKFSYKKIWIVHDDLHNSNVLGNSTRLDLKLLNRRGRVGFGLNFRDITGLLSSFFETQNGDFGSGGRN